MRECENDNNDKPIEREKGRDRRNLERRKNIYFLLRNTKLKTRQKTDSTIPITATI